MSWSTVYIKGRLGFERETLHQLEKSGFSFLPGSDEPVKGLALYWINDLSQLRAFKVAIGGKIIFKYRLRFFTDFEEVDRDNKRKQEAFTPRENALVKKMNDWQAGYNRELKNSA